MFSETPFSISVSDHEISLLRQSLALAHFPSELDGDDKLQGPPLADINDWSRGGVLASIGELKRPC